MLYAAYMGRMTGMVILLMVLLNIGGAIDLIFALGKQHWLEALTTLAWVGALNAVGVWLLRGLRDEG